MGKEKLRKWLCAVALMASAQGAGAITLGPCEVRLTGPAITDENIGDIAGEFINYLKENEGADRRYIELIRHFRLTTPVGQYLLADALLKAGLLYQADAESHSIHLSGYDDKADRARSLAEFYAIVQSWPEEIRHKFAVDFAEQARPSKLVFMENLPAHFKLTDPAVIQDVRVRVLKTFLKRWGEKKRFQDLKKLFVSRGMSKDPNDLIRWSLDYSLMSKHVPYREFMASLREFVGGNVIELRFFMDSIGFKRKLLAQYGTDVIADFMRVSGFYELPLRASEEHPNEPTLGGIMSDFAQAHPGVLPANLIGVLGEGTGDRDTYIYLLNAAFQSLDEIESHPEMDFFDLLTKAFPWPKEQMMRWSKQGRRDVLALAADIYNITGKDLFRYVKLDANDFPSADELGDLMEVIRNNYQLEAGDGNLKVTKKNPQPRAAILEAVSKEVTRLEGEAVKVSQSNIATLISLGREKFTDHIRSTLNAQESGIQFSYEDLQKLTHEWADIEPILKLFARLGDQPEVRQVVLQVFKESLNGSFGHFKFYHPDASPQVGFLNDEQMKSWTRSRVMIGSPAVEAKREKMREAASAIEAKHSDTLIPLLQKTALWDYVARAGASADEVLPLAASAARGNPLALVTEHLGADADDAAAGRLASGIFKVIGDRKVNPEMKRNMARLMVALISKPLADAAGEHKDELIGEFKEIERLVPKAVSTDFESKGFVASVIDHSPRLLLTVGDLVDTNSCQNYKTGSVIRTLPGYVIDANVQVMASFHVEAKHFDSIQDYRAVLSALEGNSLRDVRFDGNKRILKFTLADGAQIDSGYLGYAYLRQMLKLGQVEGDLRHSHHPSLRLEKAFSQNSPHMHIMEANHRAMFNELVQEMGAVQNKRMFIPRSRNPAGVYSDLGVRGANQSGVRTEEYYFEPQTN